MQRYHREMVGGEGGEGGRARSPNRKFAHKIIIEFLETNDSLARGFLVMKVIYKKGRGKGAIERERERIMMTRYSK